MYKDAHSVLNKFMAIHRVHRDVDIPPGAIDAFYSII